MPHPDNVYQDRVIRLCELAGEQGIIENAEFTGCDIKGPAVLVIQDSTLAHSNLGADPSALLWEIPLDRPRVVGAILAKNCTFEGCTFMNVGFAGPPDFVRDMKQGSGVA